jgi:hypothetical protein
MLYAHPRSRAAGYSLKINPNTGTCPIFRTKHDAELTRRIYLAAPVLVNEIGKKNSFNIKIITMYHMTNDSHLFHTFERMNEPNLSLEGNRLVHDGEVYLPLYEGKLTQIFDHRFTTFAGVSSEETKKGNSRFTTESEHKSDRIIAIPRFWVSQQDFSKTLSDQEPPSHWLTFHGIANPNNERTFIAAICPATPLGNSLPAIVGLDRLSATRSSLLLGNFNSLIFDYVARLKISSRNFNFFVVMQLPVIPPDRCTPELLDFIVPRVVELTYTAWDLLPFAKDVLKEVGNETWSRWFPENPLDGEGNPTPFRWDEERRAILRAELDGIYSHLYELDREDLDYILDTFPIVKRKDESKYGEFRTKRLVLEAFDRLAPLGSRKRP